VSTPSRSSVLVRLVRQLPHLHAIAVSDAAKELSKYGLAPILAEDGWVIDDIIGGPGSEPARGRALDGVASAVTSSSGMTTRRPGCPSAPSPDPTQAPMHQSALTRSTYAGVYRARPRAGRPADASRGDFRIPPTATTRRRSGRSCSTPPTRSPAIHWSACVARRGWAGRSPRPQRERAPGPAADPVAARLPALLEQVIAAPPVEHVKQRHPTMRSSPAPPSIIQPKTHLRCPRRWGCPQARPAPLRAAPAPAPSHRWTSPRVDRCPPPKGVDKRRRAGLAQRHVASARPASLTPPPFVHANAAEAIDDLQREPPPHAALKLVS
jgi:hypothetical protein